MLTAEGRLSQVEEFGEIVIKYKKDGSLVYLRDVSTIELGAEQYDWNAILNQKPTGLVGIYQLAGSNALGDQSKSRRSDGTCEVTFPRRDQLCHSL